MKKSTRELIEQDGPLLYFAAKEAVLAVRTPLATWKIARVSFGRDGSVYVQFPYLRRKSGILSELDVDPSITGPVTYDLKAKGVRVSTDVKFSHHTLGLVAFSKTGHVSHAPRRQSFRLDGPIGHVFQLHVNWLSGFKLLDSPKKGIAYLGFDFPDRHPSSVLIRAEWRRKRDIAGNIFPPGGQSGPATQVMKRAGGSPFSVYFLGQPKSYPLQDHLLMIAGGSIPLPSGADRPGMIFLGGWSPHEGQPDPSRKNMGNCLAFLYPVAEQSTEWEGDSTASNHGA